MPEDDEDHAGSDANTSKPGLKTMLKSKLKTPPSVPSTMFEGPAAAPTVAWGTLMPTVIGTPPDSVISSAEASLRPSTRICSRDRPVFSPVSAASRSSKDIVRVRRTRCSRSNGDEQREGSSTIAQPSESTDASIREGMDSESCSCFTGMDSSTGLFSTSGKKFEGKPACGNSACGPASVDSDVTVDVLVDALIRLAA